MLEIAAFETRRRLRGTAALTGGITLLAWLYIGLFPSYEGIDLDDVFSQMPEFLIDLFGIVALDTIEGFLAVELYQFVWVLLLGLYFAYQAAGLVAGDLERDRLDIALALPVSRRRYLLEQAGALGVTVVAVNVVVPIAIVLGLLAIGEWIDPLWLVLVHAAAVPYLLACTGIGLVLSVLEDRADVAQRAALGVVFVLYLVESVSRTVDRAWLGALAPSRYFDPTDVLVLEELAAADVAILLAMTAALVVAATVAFDRKDLTG